jgi:hypothetical protein
MFSYIFSIGNFSLESLIILQIIFELVSVFFNKFFFVDYLIIKVLHVIDIFIREVCDSIKSSVEEERLVRETNEEKLFDIFLLDCLTGEFDGDGFIILSLFNILVIKDVGFWLSRGINLEG